MDFEFDEEIREFLIESNENLAVLDQEIVELEHQPENRELISSIFRTIHSIKGTCGFFGYDILGSVTHLAESILVQLRDGQRPLTPELTSLILEAVDAVKLLLRTIETTQGEGEDHTEELRGRLEVAYRSGSRGETIKALLETASTPTPPASLSVAIVAQQEAPLTPVVAADVVAADVVGADKAPVSASPAASSVAVEVQEEKIRPRVTPVPESEKGLQEQPAETTLADSTIRVDVNLLNHLMTLVGELVLTRNQLMQAAGSFSPAEQQTSQRLNLITSELQEGVMKTRMQPIGVIWNKLPRVVRDLSSKCGKLVQIEMAGADTELDKSLIEAIRDPLTHIVRNSCDHGIERPEVRQAKGKPATGTLLLRAFHEAGAVNIEISDDGAGIDVPKVKAKAVEKGLISADQAAAMSHAEALNLIFLPGFSTAAQVTSISGRGVGMDVVKTNIEKISGCVEVIACETGGTIIRIKIPLTLAIIPGLVVSSDVSGGLQEPARQDRFVIPQSHLVEMVRVDLSTSEHLIENIHGTMVFRHRGKLLPIAYLPSIFKRSSALDMKTRTWANIIVLQVEGRQFGLIVDRICDTQEIVVKPLGRQLKHLQCYVGATIMGDGRPALILDVGGLAKLAGLEGKHRQLNTTQRAARPKHPTSELLLFRAGGRAQLAVPLAVVHRLEELSSASVEYAAGQPVARYRGEILSLLPLSALTGSGSLDIPQSDKLKVIVIHDDGRRVGLVVDEIVDIVEESIGVMRSSSEPGLLGSAVIAGKITDLVDILSVRRGRERQWNRPEVSPLAAGEVLVYDASLLSREMTRILLESAGHTVCVVSSAAELKRKTINHDIQLIVASEQGRTFFPSWLQDARQPGGLLAGMQTIILTETTVLPVSADTSLGTGIIYLERSNKSGLLSAAAGCLFKMGEVSDGTHG
jgi:two-component system chemotaxis sensor kinase CheA